jgi:hypothetical protein
MIKFKELKSKKDATSKQKKTAFKSTVNPLLLQPLFQSIQKVFIYQ